jgi:hypothetical protein
VITERTKALALRLFAAFPGRGVQEMHVLSAAEELGNYPDDIADEIVARIRADFRSPPSVAEIVEVAGEVRRERNQSQLALSRASVDVEVTEMPPEVREKVKSLLERWAEDQGPEQDWEAVKASVLHGARLKDGCSAVVGEPAVIRDSHSYCPQCGEDLDPDCMPEVRVG